MCDISAETQKIKKCFQVYNTIKHPLSKEVSILRHFQTILAMVLEYFLEINSFSMAKLIGWLFPSPFPFSVYCQNEEMVINQNIKLAVLDSRQIQETFSLKEFKKLNYVLQCIALILTIFTYFHTKKAQLNDKARQFEKQLLICCYYI